MLALPIILSNITVPLVGAVDTAVVGHLDEVELIGAVAIGASIFSLVFWTFGFLRMGTSGVVAQALGANNQSTIQLTLCRSLFLATILGAVVIALQKPLLSLCFGLLDASEKLYDYTSIYYSTRIWAAPATLANYVVLGTLIGLQRMRSVLALQLLLNILNVCLDILFVPIWGWGIRGVALATLISEYAALAFGLYLIRRQLRQAASSVTYTSLLNRPGLLSLFTLNSNIFIRTFLLVLSFFYFNACSARLGATALAANAILLQILHICSYALDGFAHAVETLTGHAWGSKKHSHFLQAIKASTIQSMVVALFMSALIYLTGAWIIGLFTNQLAVIDLALQSLPWLILLPVLSVWCYQLDGIFIGTTHSREMRNAMIISSVLFYCSTELLLPFLGSKALWLTFCLFMVMRAITLLQYMPAILKNSADTNKS